MPLLTASDLNLFEPSSSDTIPNLIPVNPYINDFLNFNNASIITATQYQYFFAAPSSITINIVDTGSSQLGKLLANPIISYSNAAVFSPVGTTTLNTINPANNQIYLTSILQNNSNIDINSIFTNIGNYNTAGIPTLQITANGISGNQQSNNQVMTCITNVLKAICDVSASNYVSLLPNGNATIQDFAVQDLMNNNNQIPSYMNTLNGLAIQQTSNILTKNNFYTNSNAIIDIVSDLLPGTSGIRNNFTTPFYYQLNIGMNSLINIQVPSMTNKVGENILAQKLLVDLYIKAYTPLIQFNILELFKNNYINTGDFINARIALLAQIIYIFKVLQALTIACNDQLSNNSPAQSTISQIFNMLYKYLENYDGDDLRNVINQARISSQNATEFSETMDQFQGVVTATQIELKNVIELNRDIKKKYRKKIAIFWVLVSLLIALFISCSVILGFFANQENIKLTYVVYGIAGVSALIVILYEFLSVLINFVST